MIIVKKSRSTLCNSCQSRVNTTYEISIKVGRKMWSEIMSFDLCPKCVQALSKKLKRIT